MSPTEVMRQAVDPKSAPGWLALVVSAVIVVSNGVGGTTRGDTDKGEIGERLATVETKVTAVEQKVQKIEDVAKQVNGLATNIAVLTGEVQRLRESLDRERERGVH